MSKQEHFSRVAGIVFGSMCLFMAAVVSLEIVLRKVFAISLQGTNELSGYIMAVSSCIAAAVAVQGRNHIRIDILHYRLPRQAQAVLNVLAACCLSVLGCILSYAAWRVLTDSWDFQSTSATPWATPLVYPQGLWLLALLVFTIMTLITSANAVRLLLRNDVTALCDNFQPRASRQEAEEEMQDMRERQRMDT